MRRIGLAATLVLAGCVGYGGGTTGGGRGLPEVAMTAQADWIVPPGRGRSALAVRAFVPGPDGWDEVAGARCRVAGAPFFRADLVTPARLVLPDLGPDAPVLVADCAAGEARGRDTVPPAFAWQRTGGTWAQRVNFGGGWWRGFEASGPMRYPDLAIGMRPG
jgi:hypothetical protein